MSETAIELAAPHPNSTLKIPLWIDEQIWGHRLWDSQSPWLIFLEFLSVAEACLRDGHLLDPSRSTFPLHFQPSQRMYLRNILFNNEPLKRIAEEHSTSGAAWTAWLRWMSENAQGVPTRDFSYLVERFASYHEFARLIEMLRRSTVEGQSNRRSTSQFVFPFGANGIYEDLALTKAGGLERQYINFGRVGELVYLMLSRSSKHAEIGEHLHRYLTAENPWNRLLGLLQPTPQEKRDLRGQSYLPYESHPAYERLAQDWLAVLRLGLPGFDTFPHLVALSAMHVMLYQLELASTWAADGAKDYMVCEIVAPKKTLVRELSAANYVRNSTLSAQAVERYVEWVSNSEAWQNALEDPVPFERCREVLEDVVWWGRDYNGSTEPEALLAELRRTALSRHRQHAGNVHRTYGREIGLVSKRGTNRLRYAPTDPLLKTLLFATVPHRMEFGEFLRGLYERYGLVIGEREAARRV